MRILGVDPALRITGFGVVDETKSGLRVVEAGIVKTKSNNSISVRLATIYQGIQETVKRLKPDCIILEKIYVHYRHPTTAYILGQARGIICLISAEAGVPLFEYAVTRVRKAVIGAGLASKTQIQGMVSTILGLEQIPKSQDITDALALAVAHSYIAKSRRQLRMGSVV